MFLLVLMALVMFLHVLGSSQTLVLKRYISSICTKSVEPRFFYYIAPTSICYYLYSIDDVCFNIVFLYDIYFANLGIFRKKSK